MAVVFTKRLPGANNGWGASLTGYSSNPLALGVVAYGPGGGSINAYSASAIDLDVWHMVTTVYNNSTGKLSVYIDGLLDTTTSNMPTPNGVVTAPLHIGKDSGSNNYYLHGVLDDLRIYGRALSNEEMQRLYNLSN
jgi:hypothetical protein